MEDYKERLLAEYDELCKRYDMLAEFIDACKAGSIEIEVDHDIDLLSTQKVHMYAYKLALFMRLISMGLKNPEDIKLEM